MRAREIALQGIGYGAYSAATQGVRWIIRWLWMGRSRKYILVPKDTLRISVSKSLR